MLFELADVYDDYEEFDKVFDCLRLILEIEPTNEEALYKICFGPGFHWSQRREYQAPP